MLNLNYLDYLLKSDYDELRLICEEIRHNSYNGADLKLHLVSHIVHHYDVYEKCCDEPMLPLETRMRCKSARYRIESIIRKHILMSYIMQ